MMTTMAEKATKIYGTEIPLKHMGKRRQQLQLEANIISNSNSAIANLEQKIIQKELQASSRSPELPAPCSATVVSGKQQQPQYPAKGAQENVCPMAAARSQAPPGGGHTHQAATAHKHHRAHHQHRTHHHRHHHHATKHLAGSGWPPAAVGGAGHHHHRHTTTTSAAAARHHLGRTQAQLAAASTTATIHQPRPGSSREPPKEPRQQQLPGEDSGQPVTWDDQRVGADQLDRLAKGAAPKEEPTKKVTDQPEQIAEQETPESKPMPMELQSSDKQPLEQQQQQQQPRPSDEAAEEGGEADERLAKEELADRKQSESIDSSSSGRSGSCSTSCDTSGEEAAANDEDADHRATALGGHIGEPATAAAAVETQPTGGDAVSHTISPVSLQVTESSLDQQQQQQPAERAPGVLGASDKSRDMEKREQSPRLALSLENVSEHQEVLRDPSKRITSDNKQREQDLVAQYEKLNIGARHSSSSIEECEQPAGVVAALNVTDKDLLERQKNRI